jgi:hypothetical protein
MSSFATFRFQRGTDLVGFAFGQLQLLHAPVTKPSVPRWAWKEFRMTCVKLCHKRRRTTCYRQNPQAKLCGQRNYEALLFAISRDPQTCPR